MTHRYRIYRKLDVTNASSAIRFYYEARALRGGERKHANSPVESRALESSQ